MHLTFEELRIANDKRALEWNPEGAPLGVEFAMVELAGEVGELANQIKKLVRAQHGLKGGVVDMENIRNEVADVVICADLLARKLEIDLGAAVVDKFNATSMKHGFKTLF